MAAQAARGFAPPILWLVSKKHIARPEFCIAKRHELGGIRPKHQSNDDTLMVTSQFWWGLLEVLVGFEESFWCIKLPINVDWCWGFPVLPKEIVQLVVKQFVLLWVGKLFLDDGNECAMIHIAYVVVIHSWPWHPFMKWHFYGDWVLVHPAPSKGWSGPISSVPACSCALMKSQRVLLMCSSWKFGSPTIFRSCLKLYLDFCIPPFQYQSPRRKEDLFRYG